MKVSPQSQFGDFNFALNVYSEVDQICHFLWRHMGNFQDGEMIVRLAGNIPYHMVISQEIRNMKLSHIEIGLGLTSKAEPACCV